MKLLTPLGLLGLLGILVLLLIYLLKPNYQQKMVSSTYVWKLSLRYRKKRLPISKLRNLLIIFCQICIITACALILTQPIIQAEAPPEITEKVAVIDASAAMRVKGEQSDTRFERAVEKVKVLSEEVFHENGIMTVILAGKEAETLAFRFNTMDSAELDSILDKLLTSDACTYGNADIDGALKLADEVIPENPYTQVLLYTSNRYIDKGNVQVVDVSEPTEWNAAILDCRAALEENYYTFYIDIACYGRSEGLIVTGEIYGTNNDGAKLSFTLNPVYCENGLTQTIALKKIKKEDKEIDIFKFDSVYLALAEADDGLSYDNVFYLYGGTEPTIRIQYYSGAPNSFFSHALLVLRDAMRGCWRVEISEVKNGSPELSGFDFYIFEHTMPTELPTDGAVLLVNPAAVPENLDITLGKKIKGEFHLSSGKEHKVTQGMEPEKIEVSEYTRVDSYEGFEPLLYCGNDPALLVKIDQTSKIAILPFSLNYSSFPIRLDFALFIGNLFNYFIPSPATVETEEDGMKVYTPKYVFDVNEKVWINTRGTLLYLKKSGSGDEDKDGKTYQYYELPAEIELPECGVYTIKQQLLSTSTSDKETYTFIYVKMPSEQSNIFRTVDSLERVATILPEIEKDDDLIVYFAAALIALLFTEWLLQARENF